jgi:YbbR domain-containing protein
MNKKMLRKINIKKIFTSNIGTKITALLLTLILWFVINASRNI